MNINNIVFILSFTIFLFCIRKLYYNINHQNVNYGSLHRNLWKCPVKINNIFNKTFYSQCDEDKIYFDLFFSKPNIQTNGIFVELGALDGTYSNTLFYEKELGWRGILIEGLPSNCKKLLRIGRRRSEVFCTAICPYFPKTAQFFDVWGMGGLTENNPFYNRVTGIYKNLNKGTVNVTCTKINEIFKNTGITHIDFFSLDVEGGEYMVLDTFDFTVRVHYWVIEFNSNIKAKDDYVTNLLIKNGYKRCILPKMKVRNECFYDPDYNIRINKLLEKEKYYYNNFGNPCKRN